METVKQIVDNIDYKCGSRTDLIMIDDSKQQHECLNCGYEFFMDFE